MEEQVFLLEQVIGNEEYRKLAPKSTPIPLRQEMMSETEQKKALRIGYYVHDGFLKPVPA